MSTQIEVPFSMVARVGDEEIQDVVAGEISVLLHDDPSEDEINAWRIGQRHPVFAPRTADHIERLAIQEARRLHQADLDAVKIAAHESQP